MLACRDSFVFVCICKGIRESDVRRLVAGRRIDPDLVIEVLGLDDPANCGRCRANIEAIIADQGGSPSRVHAVPAHA